MPGGVDISNVRMQASVEDERRPRVFDQVGGNRCAYAPALTLDETADVRSEPTTAKASNTHDQVLSAYRDSEQVWLLGVLVGKRCEGLDGERDGPSEMQ